MPMVEVDGLELHYRLDGRGREVVVMVNGLGDDLRTWDPQVPALTAAGYRVLRLDNRGIGRSSAPPGPYTTVQMARDLQGLIDALAIDEFHLVGLSMGGMIAQEVSLASPERVRSLVLACTYAAPGEFCSRLFGVWGEVASTMGVPTVMREVLLWAFTPEAFAAQPRWLVDLEHEVGAVDQQPLAAYLAQLAAVQGHDATDRLGKLNVRTLVLTGEQDALIPVQLSRALHELLPSSVFETIPGGHACSLEQPEAFNRALVAFLSRDG